MAEPRLHLAPDDGQRRRLTPGRIEPVADPANGHQVRRLFGFGLDLRAQPADMDVDRPRVAVVTVAPRSVEQLAPGPGASRVAGQDGEQIEFLGPQMDEPAVPPQLVREEIELAARGNREGPAGAGARPLVEQGEAGRELAGFDRARHRLIEAEPQGLETDVHGLGRRNLDDPQSVPAPPLARDELGLGRAARRCPEQTDARPRLLEQGDERWNVGDDTNRRAGDEPRQVEGRPVDRKREPARLRSIGPPRRGPPWTQGRAETITGCWAVVNEGLYWTPTLAAQSRTKRRNG